VKIDVFKDLLRIGAVQYGQFEVRGKQGTFAPISINLRLLPSYLAVMTSLAEQIAPLATVEGTTHLLTMPSVTPLGVVVSQQSDRVLVYPLDGQIEGAYDFNEPTVLLTDVLTDGAAELAMIKQARREGLDVTALVAIIDFGRPLAGLNVARHAWMRIEEVLVTSQSVGKLTTSMRNTVERWLAQTT
jgi:orotate phosphoribosyltransferase